MSAHPMLQPVDWSCSPDELSGEVSAERLSVYRIIWNSAIAVTLKPPVLRYTRTIAKANGLTIAVMSVMAVPSKAGYWPFRQDFPTPGWPVELNLPIGKTLLVTQAIPVQQRPLLLGTLISRMEHSSIGTPATTAQILKSIFEPNTGRSPNLELRQEKLPTFPGFRHLVAMTASGEKNVGLWRSHGLVGNSEENQQDIDKIAKGDASPQEVLQRRFPDIDLGLLERITANITQASEKWRGLSHEDGLRALAKEGANPPKLFGLPAWIDPERLLPEDHPLRLLRFEMEVDLASSIPAWGTMESEAKSLARKAWLKANHAGDPMLPEFDVEATRFNVLAHWLLGMSMKPERH